jgi:hypothetical protein
LSASSQKRVASGKILNREPVLYALTAIRTVFEILIQCPATRSAAIYFFTRLPHETRPGYMPGLLAAIAHDKRLPLFDSEYRNKKQAEVVVNALVVCLVQSANRASAWILIQNFYSG